MSQAELAERIGSKQPAIARIERGRTHVSTSTLEKLASALDSTVRVRMEPIEAVNPESMVRPWWESRRQSAQVSVQFRVDVFAWGFSAGEIEADIPEGEFVILDSGGPKHLPVSTAITDVAS